MINSLITATLYDIVKFLSENEGFYSMDSNGRKKALQESQLNNVFHDFLLQSDEQKILEELLKLSNTISNQSGIVNSTLLEKIAEYLSQDIGDILDETPLSFYILPPQEREKVVQQKFKQSNQLAQAAANILATCNYQEIIQATQKLASLVGKNNFIVVQSPREIPTELRKEIRKQLQTAAPFNYPIFQINKKIIGGIRVSKNGVLQDQSWLARVMKFTSITN